VTTDLPPSLKKVSKTYQRAKPADVKVTRAHFSKDAKPAFLQYLAQHHIEQLYAMGLNDTAINYMHNGEMPRNHPGEQLDVSIDHITSLHFGGTNDFENLMLIPSRINAMKDKLENAQIEKDTGTIETIIPANDSKVPFIDGGFQRARKSA
jgi:hypothetical protein